MRSPYKRFVWRATRPVNKADCMNEGRYWLKCVIIDIFLLHFKKYLISPHSYNPPSVTGREIIVRTAHDWETGVISCLFPTSNSVHIFYSLTPPPPAYEILYATLTGKCILEDEAESSYLFQDLNLKCFCKCTKPVSQSCAVGTSGLFGGPHVLKTRRIV